MTRLLKYPDNRCIAEGRSLEVFELLWFRWQDQPRAIRLPVLDDPLENEREQHEKKMSQHWIREQDNEALTLEKENRWTRSRNTERL